MRPSLLAAVVLAGALQLPALAALGPHVRDGILVDRGGFTLYTFEQDGPRISRCYLACAAAWPPLEVRGHETASGDFDVVAREDGSRQWAWRGKPLYRYAGDQSPGDRRGDNLAARWHLVRAVAPMVAIE